MSVEVRIQNLINTGALKEAVRDEAQIEQFLTNAQNYRDDASTATSPNGRFMLAYEGLFALAMAFLNNRLVRTDGEGHRSTALQLAIGELAADVGGVVPVLIKIHTARNKTTYFQPFPRVTEELADAAIKILDAALAGAKSQISTAPSPKS